MDDPAQAPARQATAAPGAGDAQGRHLIAAHFPHELSGGEQQRVASARARGRVVADGPPAGGPAAISDLRW